MKKRFIVILADGAREDVFRELLDAGRLPHLAQTFVAEGSFVPGTSVFPSTTGPAYMPFLTGCFPGTCNVPGIRWFNKDVYGSKKLSLERFRSYIGFESFLMNRDMRPELDTLFEIFPQSNNIFSSVNRGVPKQGNRASHMRLWYWYYAHLTDRWNLVDQAALEKSLQVIRGDFEFLFVVFPGIDTYSHLSHPRHERVLDAYQTVDHAVGEMVRELKKQQKLDETALFIVSDHGLSETKTHFGVASYLESLGLKTFYYPKIFKSGFQAASMVSGNGMLHLYFKGAEGWRGRMGRDEMEASYAQVLAGLRENEAVDLMMLQNVDGWVHVLRGAEEARLKEESGAILFENLRGNPLSLSQPQGRLSYRQALDLSSDTNYPDSLMQISQLFRSPRTGDLVLSAKRGFDLRRRFEYPEHKSSHGSLDAEHMWTPFFSSVKHERKCVRSADLFPTILKLAGKPIPSGIDGESLI